MRTLTLLPVLAPVLLLVALGGAAAADEENARLKARLRILQGRVEALEDLVEDQAVEMAELREVLERVHHHLRRRHDDDDDDREKKHKKAKKKHKKAQKKAKAKKKVKAKKLAKAKLMKAEKRALGGKPRVPQVSVGTVQHLEAIADKLGTVGEKIAALRKAGREEDFAKAQKDGRAFLRACLEDAKRVVGKHREQIKRHTVELDQRFRRDTQRLEEHLAKIEAAHGEAARELEERVRKAPADERDAVERVMRARMAQLLAAGEEAERKVHAMQAERESLKAQVEQGWAAVERAQAQIQRAAAGLERAIQDR